MSAKKLLFLLGVITLAVWLLNLTVTLGNIKLLSLVFIAFTLGLRHGFDADHIVAIDNITRKFNSENRRSYTTGLFFALGHSTIVFVLTLLIVLGVIQFKGSLGNIGDYGGIIGTIVSATFLFLTGFMNLRSLFHASSHSHNHLPAGWVMSFLTRKILNLVDRPLKMYLVGFLFGLGFDTATEIALLGIAASSALSGISVWSIMLLPISFASGMILTDSFDSIFISKLYGSFNTNQQRLLIYNRIMLFSTAMLAFIVGFFELAGLMATSNFRVSEIFAKGSDFLDTYSEQIGIAIVVWCLIIWCISTYKNKMSRV